MAELVPVQPVHPREEPREGRRDEAQLLEVARRQFGKHLLTFDNGNHPYPAWVEVQVETDHFIHDLDSQLQGFIADNTQLQFFSRQTRLHPAQPLDRQLPQVQSLDELLPKEVFRQKCQSMLGEENFDELLHTFDEVLELMHQQD